MSRDEALHRAFLAAREQLAAQRHNGVPGTVLARNYSIALEHALAAALRRLDRASHAGMAARMAVVLHGGTGRGEQCLHSDLDIGFILRAEPTDADAAFLRAFLHSLYELRAEVGHWTMTPAQLIESMQHDTHLATGLVAMRCIWGDWDLFAGVEARVRALLHEERREWFLGLIRAEVEARHRRDDTVFLLQPHIKESRGGLRDLQTLGWVAFALTGRYDRARLVKRGLITATEARRLREAQSFLIELRNAAHAGEGRIADHLTFERQHHAARGFPLAPSESTSAAEALMREYYGHAKLIDRVCTRVLRHVRRLSEQAARPRHPVRRRHAGMPFVIAGRTLQLPRQPGRTLSGDPGWMLDYFRVAAVEGLELDERVLQSMASRVDEFDDAARRSAHNRERFMAIMDSHGRAYQILSEMHRWGVLGAYLPEFALVENLPRIDHYHKYSVDEHLLRSVAASDELRDPGGPRAGTTVAIVAQNLLRVDLLNFALLMHDVGKWKHTGHVMRGAQMMKAAAERMGFNDREQEILHLLVQNHQRMSHLVLRRDPEDPNSAREIGDAVNEVEHLRMLFVHTACDMIAVSPASWNEWRAAQLTTLYVNVLEYLKGRRDQAPQSARVAPLVRTVSALETAGPMSDSHREALEDFLADMPERYRRATQAADIRRHFEMWKAVCPNVRVRLALNPRPGANYSELTAVAQHDTSLFSNLCGAIASRRMNILSAQSYLGKSGACINVFQVQGSADPDASPDEDVIERLEGRLNSVLAGGAPPVWKIIEVPGTTPRPRDDRPPTVDFNNNLSPQHTVLEIKAPDRPGLLWRIATILERNKVAVTLALISTESYRIVDVFYVNDLDMNKITSPEAQDRLRRELLAELSPGPAPGTVKP